MLASSMVAAPAHAGIESCGDINVEASAQCEVSGGVECTGQCTPVSFQAACSAQLHAECSSTCDLPSVECTGSCEGDCKCKRRGKPKQHNVHEHTGLEELGDRLFEARKQASSESDTDA